MNDYMRERLRRFVAEHPGYSLDGIDQPTKGSTNDIGFLRHEGRMVVAKLFCEPERKARECVALEHWRPTGLMPSLLWADDPSFIVISFIEGVSLGHLRTVAGDEAFRESSQAVGAAIATLTRTPLTPVTRHAFESSFFGGLTGCGTLDGYLGRILDLGRGVHVRDATFADPYWGESLAFIASRLPRLLAEPRILYDQDVGNLHVDLASRRFSGFFDLEMCGVGGASMQLAAAFGLTQLDREAWTRFRAGWESVIGAPLDADAIDDATAASQLLGWREITRYLSYDGTSGTGFSWCAPADPEWYRRSFDGLKAMLGR